MSYCEFCKNFDWGFIGYIGLMGYTILIFVLGLLITKSIYFYYEIIFLWLIIGTFAYGYFILYTIKFRKKYSVVI